MKLIKREAGFETPDHRYVIHRCPCGEVWNLYLTERYEDRDLIWSRHLLSEVVEDLDYLYAAEAKATRK